MTNSAPVSDAPSNRFTTDMHGIRLIRALYKGPMVGPMTEAQAAELVFGRYERRVRADIMADFDKLVRENIVDTSWSHRDKDT